MREFVIVLFIAAGMFFYGYLIGKDIQKKRFFKNAFSFDNIEDLKAFVEKLEEEDGGSGE